ncbi:MAG: maleylpyruvate isomerase N-terminal domain-containing protein [Hyphomonadaceae bacterium]
MEQAADFLAETEALAGLLAKLPDAAFDEATQFKGWTLNDVIRHLHFWNRAAGLQLTDEAELVRLLGAIAGKGGMRAVEREVGRRG